MAVSGVLLQSKSLADSSQRATSDRLLTGAKLCCFCANSCEGRPQSQHPIRLPAQPLRVLLPKRHDKIVLRAADSSTLTTHRSVPLQTNRLLQLATAAVGVTTNPLTLPPFHSEAI